MNNRVLVYAYTFMLLSIPSQLSAQITDHSTQEGMNYTCYQWIKPRNWGSRQEIDKSMLSVSYDYSFCAEEDTASTKLMDSHRLQIGEKHTRFYSEYTECIDSVAFTYLMSIDQKYLDQLTPDWTPSKLSRTLYSWIPEGVCPLYYDVYTDLTSHSRTVSSRFKDDEYQYTESATALNWEYLSGHATVLDHECNIATTTFRGRTWKVYYTFDIPYPYGPWKLCGLPGLILKAEDSQGLFKWEATDIWSEKDEAICKYAEGYSTDKRIYVWIPDNKIIKCKRKEVEQMWRRFWNAPLTIRFLGMGDIQLDEGGQTYVVHTSDPVPNNYYPKLELDL